MSELGKAVTLSPAPADISPLGYGVLWALLNSLAQDESSTQRLLNDYRDMQAALEAEGSSHVERLAIERVVLCHAALHCHELQWSHQRLSDHSLALAQKRTGRLQARYLEALRTLSQIRRLRIPSVQLNVAKNQVNISA